MSKLVTVITAVHGPGAHHLPDAYKSLLSQDLPDGWDWEWVIQQEARLTTYRHTSLTIRA